MKAPYIKGQMYRGGLLPEEIAFELQIFEVVQDQGFYSPSVKCKVVTSSKASSDPTLSTLPTTRALFIFSANYPSYLMKELQIGLHLLVLCATKASMY